LFLDVTNPSDYTKIESLYIEIIDQLTPFFIESFILKNHPFALVKFEGVDNEIDAKIIDHKDLYLPATFLKQLSGTNFYDHEVVGFKCIDGNYGEVGIIQGVIDLSINPLLQIMNGEKEVLVPLIKNLVTKVDRENKELHIVAPVGLIEIYLD
jgi:16S rRNA processing protein RimM